MTIIKAERIKNTIPILSMNGSSGNMTFNKAERGMVNTAAVSAAFEVVFFQKKPNIKIAKTPGEIKPVYSWIYWKAWSKALKAGATIAAITKATTAAIRPTLTCLFSDALASKKVL